MTATTTTAVYTNGALAPNPPTLLPSIRRERTRIVLQREVPVDGSCRTCGPVTRAIEKQRLYLGATTPATLHCVRCRGRVRVHSTTRKSRARNRAARLIARLEDVLSDGLRHERDRWVRREINRGLDMLAAIEARVTR